MSYFNPDVDAISSSSNGILKYNYGAMDIYYKDINTLKNQADAAASYLKIPYSGNNMTLSYGLNQPIITPSTFFAQNLYLFGLLHNNITGITISPTPIIGELVIENTNSANSTKIYTCFFIQSESSPKLGSTKNDIDNLIDMIQSSSGKSQIPSISSNLNNLLTTDSKNKKDILIYQDNNKNYVILYLLPINVAQTTATYIEKNYDTINNLFSVAAPNMVNQVSATSVGNGAGSAQIVTGDDDKVEIDCNPIEFSDETIKTYKVPINSEYSGMKDSMDYMKLTMHFYMFMIGVIFAYFAIPGIYKHAVVNRILKKYTEAESGKKLFATNILILILFVVNVTILIKFGDINMTSIGILLCFVYLLSVPLISINLKDADFRKFNTSTLSLDSYKTAQWTELFSLFKDMLDSSDKNTFISIFFALLLLIVVILAALWAFGKLDTNNAISNFKFIIIPLIPFSLLIFASLT